jgi:hypothetical protein
MKLKRSLQPFVQSPGDVFPGFMDELRRRPTPKRLLRVSFNGGEPQRARLKKRVVKHGAWDSTIMIAVMRS